MYPFFWKCTHWDTKLKCRLESSLLLTLMAFMIATIMFVSNCREFYHYFRTDVSIWETENVRVIGQLCWSLSVSTLVTLMPAKQATLKDLITKIQISLNSTYGASKKEIIDKLYSMRRKAYLRSFAVAVIVFPMTASLYNKPAITLMQISKTYIFWISIVSSWAFLTLMNLLSELSLANIEKVLSIKRDDLHLNFAGNKTNLNLRNVLKQLTAARLMIYHVIQAVNWYLSPTIIIFWAMFLPSLYALTYTVILGILLQDKTMTPTHFFWIPFLFICEFVCEECQRQINMV
ncbi:hypothetical protein Trydic_g6328 [Trypoxylus dichotomus]